MPRPDPTEAQKKRRKLAQRYAHEASSIDRMADMAPSDSVEGGLRSKSARLRKYVRTAKKMGY